MRIHILAAALFVLAVVFGPLPLLAEEGDVDDGDVSEDELRILTEGLAADGEALDDPGPAEKVERAPRGDTATVVQKMMPDIALILDVAGAYFSEEENLQLGGHDPSQTGFNLQQLEMSIGSSVDPYFRFDANLVFSQFGVEVEEAYATTLGVPGGLQFRAGQFLTRFGRLNNTHPHSWSFVDQPIVVGKFFGGEGNRELGVEGSWLAPLPWYVELVGSAHNPFGESTMRSYYGSAQEKIRQPDDLVYTAALKQFFALTDDWSLFWGLSAQFGPNTTGPGNRSEIYATDLYLRWRPIASARRTAVSLQAEGMFRTRQVPNDVLQDWGGYAQLVWTISPRWETGVRCEYVTGVEDDYLDPDWTEPRERTALQVTFYPSHFSRIRLQGARDDARWLDDPIWTAFLALELVVGAHGAHTY